jgi:tRNA pseudouridine55 synthase
MVKKALGTGKVGHAGTLDKFAEGLLIFLTGRCTKLIPWFMNCDKTYRGIVKFGIETDTLDPEGEIIKECSLPLRENVEAVIPQFTGKIMQAPPAYSAIHIDGKRAYQLARDGAEIEMKKRPIEIYNLQLEKYENGEGAIIVDCSKGTYIRSLARDLAYTAGSCAHLVYLNRTSIAGFLLEQAVNPSSESDTHELIRQAVRPVNKAMFEALKIPTITIDCKTAESLINGKPINKHLDASEITLICMKYRNFKTSDASQDALDSIQKDTNFSLDLAIFSENERFVGIIQKKNNVWQYGYIYNPCDAHLLAKK